MLIDPFVPPHEQTPLNVTHSNAISLYELNVRVRTVLRRSMQPSYWIAAELSELRVASNGHCYVEFVQKDEYSGSLIAKARGIIWSKTYLHIADRFHRETGQNLRAGMKIMAEVEVEFHELYGFSLTVVDVDPAYTLGDMERRRREIVQRLQDDGVVDLNKELPLPKLITRIAVISSATAAGYGDFCNQLEQSGYHFSLRLFAATMQGDNVESSVIEALNKIAECMDDWDVVVIIRGGGAVTDLGGFDSYLLAANVAQFPLPVLTGIGHERDDTIVDMVAHRRLKTPTAVAAFLIEQRSDESARIADLAARIVQSAANMLAAERNRADRLQHRLALAVAEERTRRRSNFETLVRRYERATSQFFSAERRRLMLASARLQACSEQMVRQRQHLLALCLPRITASADRLLLAQRHRLDMAARSVQLAAPDRILALGFSITLRNGRAVRSADELKEGDTITTRFARGTAVATITHTSEK